MAPFAICVAADGKHLGIAARCAVPLSIARFADPAGMYKEKHVWAGEPKAYSMGLLKCSPGENAMRVRIGVADQGESRFRKDLVADVPRGKRNAEANMSRQGLPTEFELIARYFAPLACAFPGAYGLLDDAAVISPASDNELVVKTDTIVGGIDFLLDEPANLIARKALRVNLSDLAAKGAVPRAYLLDLVLPNTVDELWIAVFAAGLAHDQAEYGMHLIGGDMSSTSGPITIAVTVFGEAPIGRIIRRGGAQRDDTVFSSPAQSATPR